MGNILSTNIKPPVETALKQQIPNGYSGSDSVSTDSSIPRLGIEDADIAVYDLFDKTLPFVEMDVVDQTERILRVKKPVVVYASGERFALAKRLKPLRDKEGVLILPAVAIRRTNFTFDAEERNNRGMSQDTGEVIIKRKLSPQDVSYQQLLNRTGFKNRQEVFSSTRENVGSDKDDAAILAGMLLDPKKNQNVYEIIAAPSPKFFKATYEVTIWAQFTESMNHILEVLLTSQLPQTSGYKLVTESGYWLIGYHNETFEAQDNFDDYTDEEKLHKYSFSLEVKAALFAGSGVGQPVPLKRYYSVTDVGFSIVDSERGRLPHKKDNLAVDADPFTLSPLVGEEDAVVLDSEKQQKPTSESLFTEDYADNNGVIRQRTPVDRNTKKGETVYKADSREELFNVFYPVKGSR